MAASTSMVALGMAALLTLTGVATAQERPPKPLSVEGELEFPPYEIRTLPNGMRVVVVLHHEQPAVTVRLLVQAGSAMDPSDKPGVASLMGMLLDQGTGKRSAQQIADTIDYIGGSLVTGAGTDMSFVQALVMKDSFDDAMDLVADLARNPAFSPEEIERQRSQRLSALKVNYQDPDYVADSMIDRLVYGFHPYGIPADGTPESLARITREDLAAFHGRWFVPNNCLLAIVGDLRAGEAFKGAERVFGDWKRGELPSLEATKPPPPTRRVVVVDRPNAIQTEIRVGQLAIARKHPDYMPLMLAINVLGGEGANRLHNVLRSERGLTYGASADMDPLKRSGDIIASTDTRSESTGEALRLVIDEFWRLRREPVGQRELQGAQDYLTGSFPLDIERPDMIALEVLQTLFYDLDVEELETYRDRVRSVTVQDIARVGREYLQPDRLSIVLVGDARKIGPQLQTIGIGDFERVALANLDFTTADFLPRAAAAPAAR
ncbi:MAG: M16 family metallopeptidase [Vicinamibacteraceae bacterium]